MNADKFRPDEERVLMAFSVEPNHDRATLETYLTQYPEHALAIVDCSIELMMDVSHSDNDQCGSSDQAIDQAWQQFQAMIGSAENLTAPIDPFAQLGPTAFKLMVKRLDVSNLFLIRVRERVISAVTIPQRFIECLASALDLKIDEVWAYLRIPPTTATTPGFRSIITLEAATQITFDEAVETSQLTPLQKEALRAFKD